MGFIMGGIGWVNCGNVSVNTDVKKQSCVDGYAIYG
jgi:hypothetical protein